MALSAGFYGTGLADKANEKVRMGHGGGAFCFEINVDCNRCLTIKCKTGFTSRFVFRLLGQNSLDGSWQGSTLIN